MINSIMLMRDISLQSWFFFGNSQRYNLLLKITLIACTLEIYESSTKFEISIPKNNIPWLVTYLVYSMPKHTCRPIIR